MKYYYGKTIMAGFDDVVQKTIAELKKEGFGVLTEIDVSQTLKEKLDVDFRKYQILGACNPPFAYQALQSEDNIGVFLPCNVVVQEKNDNEIKVSAVSPKASMMSVDNADLEVIADQIEDKLKSVIDHI